MEEGKLVRDWKLMANVHFWLGTVVQSREIHFSNQKPKKRKKKHALRYMTRIRLTATNRNRYQNALLRVLLSASVI